MNKLYNGDCLNESDKIESGSVDLILTDLPYGVVKMKEKSGNYAKLNTAEKWDKAIEPQKIFEIANRILRKNGKMILFSQEPYSNELINNSLFELPLIYKMYWEKNDFANWVNDVFKEKDLAKKIKSVNNPQNMVSILENHFKQGK